MWDACRYLENVPAIVPLLEKEYRNAAARLEATQEELNDLHPDKYALSAPLPELAVPEVVVVETVCDVETRTCRQSIRRR